MLICLFYDCDELRFDKERDKVSYTLYLYAGKCQKTALSIIVISFMHIYNGLSKTSRVILQV